MQLSALVLYTNKNPKQYLNSNVLMSKTARIRGVWIILVLVIWICLEFRYWDLEL